MTIQWTLVATFLYCEIAFITLLLLPFISPSLWQYLFQSRICKALASRANIYFSIFLAVLVLFFLDSIREMQKYSAGLSDHEHSHSHLDSEIQMHMKLFRSQRNFYIAGFSLFFWFVIRRLVTLISTQASLAAENEASIKQAQSATETAQRLMKKKLKMEGGGGNQQNGENLTKEMSILRRRLATAENELALTKNALSVTQTQAEAVSEEYDQLLKRYTIIQREVRNMRD